jgi:hypothetical protein
LAVEPQGDPEGIDVLIHKRQVIRILRSRGQFDRADWVERDLPDEFETGQHAGLLQTLRIAPSDLADVDDDDEPGPSVRGADAG